MKLTLDIDLETLWRFINRLATDQYEAYRMAAELKDSVDQLAAVLPAPATKTKRSEPDTLGEFIMLDLTQFKEQLARFKTVKEGVIAFIKKLKENAGDPVELKRLVDEFDAQQDELAAAIEEGTTPPNPPNPPDPPQQ